MNRIVDDDFPFTGMILNALLYYWFRAKVGTNLHGTKHNKKSKNIFLISVLNISFYSLLFIPTKERRYLSEKSYHLHFYVVLLYGLYISICIRN